MVDFKRLRESKSKPKPVNPREIFNSLPKPPGINDLYASQARELDVKKREAMVHQIQQTIRDKVINIPLFEQAFIWGVGPRVAEAGDGRIPGFGYSAPFEDLRLK